MEINGNQRTLLLEKLQSGFYDAGFGHEDADAMAKKTIAALRQAPIEVRDIPEALFDVKGTINAIARFQGQNAARIKKEVEGDTSILLRHHQIIKQEIVRTEPPVRQVKPAKPEIAQDKQEKAPSGNDTKADKIWPNAATIFETAAHHGILTRSVITPVEGFTPGQLSVAFKKGLIKGWEKFCPERPETYPGFLVGAGLATPNTYGIPTPVRTNKIEDLLRAHNMLQDELPLPKARM